MSTSDASIESYRAWQGLKSSPELYRKKLKIREEQSKNPLNECNRSETDENHEIEMIPSRKALNPTIVTFFDSGQQ